MAGKLQESYSDLENKVETRTRALAQSVGELRALGEISKAVNSTLDLETVLDTIVSKSAQLAGTETGAIYVYDDATREYRLRATYGMSDDLIAAIKNLHVDISDAVGELTESKSPVQIADLLDAPHSRVDSRVNETLVKAGYRARLLVPLVAPDGVVGALVVRRRAPGEFPQSTIDLMQTFAAQSVLAIQNARLFGEIGEKSRQLASTSRSSSPI
jgi:GAF domain-containing protein